MSINEDDKTRLYSIVAKEMELNKLDADLLARATIESGPDEKNVRHAYSVLRFQRLLKKFEESQISLNAAPDAVVRDQREKIDIPVEIDGVPIGLSPGEGKKGIWNGVGTTFAMFALFKVLGGLPTAIGFGIGLVAKSDYKTKYPDGEKSNVVFYLVSLISSIVAFPVIILLLPYLGIDGKGLSPNLVNHLGGAGKHMPISEAVVDTSSASNSEASAGSSGSSAYAGGKLFQHLDVLNASPKWALVNDDGNTSVYYDQDRVMVSEPFRGVWVLSNSKINGSSTNSNSTAFFWEIDCGSSRIRTTEEINFDGWIKNKKIASNNVGIGKFVVLPPDSIGQKVALRACAVS